MTARRRPVLYATAVIAAALSAASALAVWTTVTQPGNVVGTVQQLSAPTVNAPAAGTQKTNSVTVTWTASQTTGGAAATSYNVVRIPVVNGTDGTPATACGGAIAAPTLTCPDTLPADGSYKYKVTAVYKSWTKMSAASAVRLVDTTAPAVVLDSLPSRTKNTKPTIPGTAGIATASSSTSADNGTVSLTITGPSSFSLNATPS